MATTPISGASSSPLAANTTASETTSPTDTPAQPEKPAIQPPLVRPFSLSLPPENQTAQAIVKNIDESNKETERLTKQSAKEDQLKKLADEQLAKDQLLNGPGTRGV
jgi:hypothetical protein